MSQDRESGAKAVEYGLATAKKIAREFEAKKIGNPRSNEYEIDNKKIVIKCARATTNSVGVPYQMLDRIEAIYGAFEINRNEYEIIEISSKEFSENMRATRSKGASAGRVGIVRKSYFQSKGKFVKKIKMQ
jgi:hypothetical protein